MPYLKLTLAFLTLIICSYKTEAQNFKDKLYTRGYIKNLQTAYLFDGFKKVTLESRIHNRIQLEYYINDHLTFNIETRNQFIYGGFVKSINEISDNIGVLFPDLVSSYGEQITLNNQLLDFNFILAENNSSVLIAQIDRLWLKWQKEQWEIQIGKQRINWGNNFIWNANDLFNTQSFLDFDYEERPGTDAIRITNYLDYASRIEFVFAPQKTIKKSTSALLYQFNRKNYDFQTILGYYQHQLALGLGWAGNIKNAGFKGEISFYQPFESDKKANIVGSIGFDFSTQKSWLLQAELLYNGFGNTDQNFSEQLFSASQLGPQNIWFGKYALAFNTNYAFNPRLSFSGSMIWNPGDFSPKQWNVFLVPALQVTLSDDFDFFVNAQLNFPNKIDLLSSEDFNFPDVPSLLEFLSLENNNILTSERLLGSVSARIRWSF